MKPAPFDYIRPRTITDACGILSDAGGGATVIAGGQTLMPLLALRMSQPFILVDINGIPELKGVSRDGASTRIGPMTGQNDIIADPLLIKHLPVLVEAVRHVGHHQTRNRGTIGGSIAFGDPAAESPAAAVVLGAVLEVQSTRGTRRIPAEEFYFGPYANALEPDELLTAIDIPDWPEDSVTLFKEVTPRPGDFALVGLIGVLTLDGPHISRASIAWFGMGPTPIRATQAEQALLGRDVARLDVAAIADLAIADTTPFDDIHASTEYRCTVGRRLFAKTLNQSLNARQTT